VNKTDQIVVKGKKGKAALSDFIGELEELLPWFTSKRLEGITVKRKGKGWMLILRASKGKERLVAFSESDSLLGVWRNLYRMVVYDKGYWKPDKFN